MQLALHVRCTWRIIPLNKWLITMTSKSPKDRVVGPLPNGLSTAYKWGLLTTYIHWDDPPSMLEKTIFGPKKQTMGDILASASQAISRLAGPLKRTASSPLKNRLSNAPKMKNSSSKHHFSGANLLLVSVKGQ